MSKFCFCIWTEPGGSTSGQNRVVLHLEGLLEIIRSSILYTQIHPSHSNCCSLFSLHQVSTTTVAFFTNCSSGLLHFTLALPSGLLCQRNCLKNNQLHWPFPHYRSTLTCLCLKHRHLGLGLLGNKQALQIVLHKHQFIAYNDLSLPPQNFLSLVHVRPSA
jgi:hypothetical protein